MDYKHISSPSLSGPGQRSVGRVLILILSANSVPATPQLGPLLSLTLPLSQNFYWSSDILTNIGNLIAALPRSSAFNIFAFLSALNWLKMFLHATLLGWIFPPSEAERWKRDVKNIMFCTCQCWTSTAYVKWKFKFSILSLRGQSKKVGVANNYCHGVVVKSETKFCHKIHFCLPWQLRNYSNNLYIMKYSSCLAYFTMYSSLKFDIWAITNHHPGLWKIMEFCCGGGSEELGLVSAAWGQKNISGVINGQGGRELAWPGINWGWIYFLFALWNWTRLFARWKFELLQLQSSLSTLWIFW